MCYLVALKYHETDLQYSQSGTFFTFSKSLTRWPRTQVTCETQKTRPVFIILFDVSLCFKFLEESKGCQSLMQTADPAICHCSGMSPICATLLITGLEHYSYKLVVLRSSILFSAGGIWGQETEVGEVEERHHYQDEPAAREQGTYPSHKQGTYPSHKPGNLDHKHGYPSHTHGYIYMAGLHGNNLPSQCFSLIFWLARLCALRTQRKGCSAFACEKCHTRQKLCVRCLHSTIDYSVNM